jgi:hypothetical protein
MRASRRFGGRWLGLLLGGVAGLSAFVPPAMAQDVGQSLGHDLKRFLHDDAVATVHLRSYFLDRTNPQPPNNAAWAGGGWIGYETGWLWNALKLGAVGYTSQPLWAPPGTDGTGLLETGQYGFFVLGQAYGSIRFGDQVFTGYRQLVDELEVNPNDDRMVPNTFEAYALRGEVGPVDYFAGYVAAMKPKDSSTFVNMAERAGTPAGYSAGMLLGSLKYGSIDTFRLRAAAYYVQDTLTSSYGDAAKTVALSDAVKVRLAGNAMVQGSNGQNLLTGTSFSTWSAGSRATLLWQKATLWGAYTQTGSAAPYRTPYGQWIGYTKQITKDFDRANERALQAGVTYDFAGLGIPGLTFLASGTFGSGALDASTGSPLANNTEYDFDVIYRLTANAWPEWLKPLELRSRVAYVDSTLSGTTTTTTEYRFILNYEVKFKGFTR